MPPINIYDILDNYDNFKTDFLFREQGFAITGFPVSPICMVWKVPNRMLF